MAVPDDITLTPAFAAVAATGFDIGSLAAANPTTTRATRLEVPIDVQAVRVAKGEKVERAGISTAANIDAVTQPADGDVPTSPGAPPPFTTLAPRETGIYVHWAMPDALARATVAAESESDIAPDAEAEFPALPNRWSLTRFWYVGQSYRSRSWMIEADRARVVDHDEWSEVDEVPDDGSAATPQIGPDQLTAVLGGDAAWFTVFDNVVNRFAFHDDLSDIIDDPGTALPNEIHYTVSGWYSDDDLDPLAGTSWLGGFDERLAELGWTADTSSLHAQVTSSAVLKEQIEQVASIGDTSSLGGNFVSTSAKSSAYPDISEAAHVSQLMLNGADFVLPTPIVFWPQRSLYHGTIYSVITTGGNDAKPSEDGVEVGLGGTTTEALSSLMAESIDEVEEGAREQLLNALQYNLIGELESPDGPPRLGAEAHRRTFESQPGGFTTERIRMGDPFAHLRPEPRPGGLTVDQVGTLHDGVLTGGVVFEMMDASPETTAGVHTRFVDDNVDRAVDRDLEVGTSGTVSGGGRGPGGAFFEHPPADVITPEVLGSPDVIKVSEQFDPSRSLADTFTQFDANLDVPRIDQAIEYRTVKRALPRLFFPQDPAIAMRGAGRTLRFRNNTTLDEDGRLVCRLSGTESTIISGIVNGSELQERPMSIAEVPVEAKDLLDEAVLNTIGGAENIATSVRSSARTSAAAMNGLDRRLIAEDRVYERYLVPGSSAGDLLADSLKDGTFVSPKAITVWQQPWEPTYLEWKLDLRLDRRRDHWSLGDLDIELREQLEPDFELALTGRSLLSGSASNSIADLLAAFLDEEENVDCAPGATCILDDAALEDLRDLNDAAQLADVLSASFDGVRDRLLGFTTNSRITVEGTDGEILPDELPELLRSGTATLIAVRLVDSFGRFLDVPAPYSVADSVEVTDDAGVDEPDTFLLPQRVLAPTRLWFRFVDATDDTSDAFLDQENDALVRNPVAAWLLPDHVDEALEVFDSTGDPLGQLRNDRLGGGVLWEGAPGRPGPMGRPPFADIADRHTAEFARAIIERDAAERQAGKDHGESTLDAFLRTVDTTLWTVDPFADSGLDYYSKMTGRPIAVVRARLLLDVVSDVGVFAPDDPRRDERGSKYEELSRRRFEVRLGSLAQIDDGLLGYFVNDDYRHFFPVHASVPLEASPSGRNTGFLASAAEAATFDPTIPKPITHPYVVADPTVDVQVGHPVRLTLLLDPGAKVHATCGLVPRKSIALPRGFVDDALARIAPSFRFGPLLVDPAVIRMPKPAALPEDQVWTRRDSPTSWRDDPIEAATQFAYLPDTSHEAQEGYVRVHLDI